MPSERAPVLETAGSKDSGVFTTSGSVFNYQFDGPYATMDNGYGTGRRSNDGYDEEPITPKGWPDMQQQQQHHHENGASYDYYG